MGGAPADPLLALPAFDVGCGTAALAVVIAGSDLRPSEYPNPKNSAQIPTNPKNRTSSLPVPSVISVSSDEAMVDSKMVALQNASTQNSSTPKLARYFKVST